MRIVPVVAAALIDKDDRILLAQRPEGKNIAGLWEFPGGKIEKGETPEAALVRELQEEVGVNTYESCLAPFTFASHGYEDFHLVMYLFLCRKWEGIPQGKEEQALQWVHFRKLAQVDMPEANAGLVAMLRDFL